MTVTQVHPLLVLFFLTNPDRFFLQRGYLGSRGTSTSPAASLQVTSSAFNCLRWIVPSGDLHPGVYCKKTKKLAPEQQEPSIWPSSESDWREEKKQHGNRCLGGSEQS